METNNKDKAENETGTLWTDETSFRNSACYQFAAH